LRMKTYSYGLLICCCVAYGNAAADFFKMPDLTEMPQLERKSLLKDLDIPGVRDRDPDPESGPRLNITKFKLEGIVEYPELGINKNDIDELIEGIRYDLMEEFKVLESGFTASEIEEVTRLIAEIEEETQDRHVTELEVQKLVWLVREQRSKRGVTLGQIETVADRITRFYRERGFILAKAYIPEQQVRDGVVTLTLLLGTLGEVDVVESGLYRKSILVSVFDDWLTKPVTDAVIEENLYLINDFPGIVATGYFQPGAQVGDTRLNLNLVDEQVYEASFRFDNHGSEETGQSRFYAELQYNNPLGNADQLSIAGLLGYDPNNTEYYQIRYSSMVIDPRFTLSGGVSTNDFVIGPGNSEAVDDLELFGVTDQRDLTATYRFKRSRTNSLLGVAKYEKIESELRVGLFDENSDAGLDDIVENYSFSFSYDLLDEEDRSLYQGDISLTSGSFKEGKDIGQDEDYFILGMNYSLLTFWRMPVFNANTRLIYRSSLQFTDSALSSINQYALAGPTRVRAYESNQFSGDVGVYAGVDWVFDAPAFLDWNIGGVNLRNITRPFLFLDLAWGQTWALVDELDDETGQLLGAGLGLQFFNSDRFQGNFQIAYPLEEKFSSSDVTVEDDGPRLVLDFQFSFK